MKVYIEDQVHYPWVGNGHDYTKPKPVQVVIFKGSGPEFREWFKDLRKKIEATPMDTLKKRFINHVQQQIDLNQNLYFELPAISYQLIPEWTIFLREFIE